MDNGDEKKKLTLKNISLLILFGLLIITFKYYLTRGDFCKESCTNINSELDIIKCLDACSINAEDYREPVSNIKIVLYSSILVIFFIFLFRCINNCARRNTNNTFLRFLQWIKKLKDSLINQEKLEYNRYKKFE